MQGAGMGTKPLLICDQLKHELPHNSKRSAVIR